MSTLPGLPVKTSPTTQQNAPGNRFEWSPEIARLTSVFSAETPRSSYVVTQRLPWGPAAAPDSARHLSGSRAGRKNPDPARPLGLDAGCLNLAGAALPYRAQTGPGRSMSDQWYY